MPVTILRIPAELILKPINLHADSVSWAIYHRGAKLVQGLRHSIQFMEINYMIICYDIIYYKNLLFFPLYPFGSMYGHIHIFWETHLC